MVETQEVVVKDFSDEKRTWRKVAFCPKCKVRRFGVPVGGLVPRYIEREGYGWVVERLRMVRVYVKTKVEDRGRGKRLTWIPVGWICPNCGLFALDPDVSIEPELPRSCELLTEKKAARLLGRRA
jgi:hypothetical protein